MNHTQFDHVYSNKFLTKYCILMKSYKRQNLKESFDTLILLINQNINCDKLIEDSEILNYPLHVTLILNCGYMHTNMLSNYFNHEVHNFILNQSTYRYIFYEVQINWY